MVERLELFENQFYQSPRSVELANGFGEEMLWIKNGQIQMILVGLVIFDAH